MRDLTARVLAPFYSILSKPYKSPWLVSLCRASSTTTTTPSLILHLPPYSLSPPLSTSVTSLRHASSIPRSNSYATFGFRDSSTLPNHPFQRGTCYTLVRSKRWRRLEIKFRGEMRDLGGIFMKSNGSILVIVGVPQEKVHILLRYVILSLQMSLSSTGNTIR